MIERGDRISVLIDRTDNLNQTTLQFRQRSTNLRRRMWCTNQKTIIVVIISVFTVLGVLILLYVIPLLNHGNSSIQ